MRPVAFSTSVAVIVAALALAPAATAQSVDEIVARNITAKGGAELLRATTSVRTTGKGTMNGAEITVSAVNKRPYFFRSEMALGDQKRTIGFDGTNLWISMGGMPAQTLPPGPQADSLKLSSQIDSPLLDYQAKGTRIELSEPLAEAGRTLHHLIVTPKGAPAMHYYIDPLTNLESRMIIEADENGQKMKMELRFSDFTAVDGRNVPLTVTQLVNGKQVGTMKYDTVEFNVPLDEALFRMPK